jgi:S-adenosylmethionine-diacylglycerol 3-amino-3-carboxypropyl transferase
MESYLQDTEFVFDGANLSDIFEYMSEENYRALLAQLVSRSAPGARLVYWNMMVPRGRPDDMSGSLDSLVTQAAQLHAQDKAFFYSSLVIEQVRS